MSPTNLVTFEEHKKTRQFMPAYRSSIISYQLVSKANNVVFFLIFTILLLIIEI